MLVTKNRYLTFGGALYAAFRCSAPGGKRVYQAPASFSVTIQVIFAEESKMMRPYDVVG